MTRFENAREYAKFADFGRLAFSLDEETTSMSYNRERLNQVLPVLPVRIIPEEEIPGYINFVDMTNQPDGSLFIKKIDAQWQSKMGIFRESGPARVTLHSVTLTLDGYARMNSLSLTWYTDKDRAGPFRSNGPREIIYYDIQINLTTGEMSSSTDGRIMTNYTMLDGNGEMIDLNKLKILQTAEIPFYSDRAHGSCFDSIRDEYMFWSAVAND